MVAIVSVWGVPALVRTQGEFLRIGIGRHVIGRSFGALEGHGGNSLAAYLVFLPFYFVTLFGSLFPWSIKIPAAFGQLWRKRDGIDNYLLYGAAIIFCVFTLAKTKLPHYTLPALPLLALLLARVLVAKSTSFLKYCAIATTIVFAAVALFVPLLVAPLFPARELFLKSRDYLEPKMEFATVDFNEPSLVWYFRGRVKTFMTQLDRRSIVGFMAKTGPRFAILPTPTATEVLSERARNWKTFSASGFNLVKGKRIELTLILKPE
jgi:hypothetical protein